MSETPSAWVAPVDKRIEIIASRLHNNAFAKEVPGLKTLLDNYLDPNVPVDKVDFHRGLLAVFRDSKTDATYQDLLSKYTEDERERLEKFVDGEDPAKISDGFVMGPSLGCREELQLLQKASRIFKVSADGPVHVAGLSSDELETQDDPLHKFVHGLANLFHKHGNTDDVQVYQNAAFQNWGLNIINKPQFTCVPKTRAGIQRIVQYAKLHDLSVRCSGYRHSWSPIFGRNGQILISMLDLKTATKLPNTTSLPFPESKPDELETIDIMNGTPRKNGNTLVRVGCAVTNERLRRWCVEHNRVTLPLNVIMVEITLGGSNAPICHGAGRRNQTLSDLVREIEFVNVHGELQTVNDPKQLRAASGCFGLLGVVTRITIEFSPMTYAQTSPLKIPVIKAVPPPPDMKDEDIPKALFIQRSDEEKAQDQAAFEKRARDDYYSEWFWFPFSDFAWVNCWNDITDPSNVVDFPDKTHIFLSFVETVTMNVLQNTPLLDKLISAVHLNEAAVTLISRAALFALPDKPVKTYLTDALHFQRAIQNVRVRDVEVEMPLLPKPGQPNEPDFHLVQRAWWDAILRVYAHTDTCPQRMPLEMRIMGGSDVVLAPQRYNNLGTCSIEVLTLHSASDIWQPFAQEVLDKWTSYTDASGKKLNTRPHWAKEWKTFKVDGKPWPEVLKNESYREEIKEFKALLEEIGRGKWSLEDLKKRFSNEFFDWLIYDDVGVDGQAPAAAVELKNKSFGEHANGNARVGVTEIH